MGHCHHGDDAWRHHHRRGPWMRSWAGMGGPWAAAGGGRRARRGDVRQAVLFLLAEGPMHGYQVIQELEQRTGGAWRPSPGSVYPTLQLLSDEGLVTSEEVGGKRVYSLTDAGRAKVDESKDAGAPWSAAPGEDEPRIKLRDAMFQLGAATMQVGRTGSNDDITKTIEILTEARRRVYGLLADSE